MAETPKNHKDLQKIRRKKQKNKYIIQNPQKNFKYIVQLNFQKVPSPQKIWGKGDIDKCVYDLCKEINRRRRSNRNQVDRKEITRGAVVKKP